MAKASFRFQNGNLSEMEDFDGDMAAGAHIIIPIISTFEGVKFMLSPFIVQNKMSGKVFLEMTDDLGLHVAYEGVKEPDLSILKTELKRTYNVSDRTP